MQGELGLNFLSERPRRLHEFLGSGFWVFPTNGAVSQSPQKALTAAAKPLP